MEETSQFLKAIYLGSGFLGLLAGVLIPVLQKGNHLCQRMGRTFSLGMILCGGTWMGLSIHFQGSFHFLPGLWLLFLSGTGYGYIHHLPHSFREWPRILIRMLALVMLLTSVASAGYGVQWLFYGHNTGAILLAAGWVGLLFVRQDLQYVRRGIASEVALRRHFQRFAGVAIVGLTAILAATIGCW